MLTLKENAMLRIFSAFICCLLAWQSIANDDVTLTKTSVSTSVSNDAELATLFKKLPVTKLSKMQLLIEQLSATKTPQVKQAFNYLLNGELYYIKANKQVVHAQINEDKKYALTDVLTNTPLDVVAKSKIRKIKTNNRLRGSLRSLLAQFDLTDPNKEIRIAAVKQLLDKPNQTGIDTMTKWLKKDPDTAVPE